METADGGVIKAMKSREEIITCMCYTRRHDYGLQKQQYGDFSDAISSGMTDRERKMLWSAMAQLFDNEILPILKEHGIKI